MKVLGLCLSPGVGGLELYVLREMLELQRRGHRCIAVTARESMLARKFSATGIDSFHIKPLNRHFPLMAAWRLAQVIDREKIDIIHVSWAKDLNLAALAKRISNKKPRLLFTRHMGLTRSKQDLLHRWFYQQIDKYLCVSTMVESQARQHLGLADEKIQLLHLGVKAANDLQPDRNAFYRKYGLRQARLNIAVFGRIEEGKGQHIIVAAVKRLIANGLDVSLTIIGHIVNLDYQRDLLAGVEKDGVTASIRFIPFIENATDSMPNFDVIALTTYEETFGLVLIEAMRAGVAVIGTAAGGVLDIIENDESGLLVEPKNVAALAEAIETLYGDTRKRKRLAENGKRKADQQFCEAKHFDQLEYLMRALI